MPGVSAKSLNQRGGATVRTRLVLIDGYKATDVRSGSPESASGAVGGPLGDYSLRIRHRYSAVAAQDDGR